MKMKRALKEGDMYGFGQYMDRVVRCLAPLTNATPEEIRHIIKADGLEGVIRQDFQVNHSPEAVAQNLAAWMGEDEDKPNFKKEVGEAKKKSGRSLTEALDARGILEERIGFDIWKNKVVAMAARLLNVKTWAVEKLIRYKDLWDEMIDGYTDDVAPNFMANDVAKEFNASPAFAEGIIKGSLKQLMSERPLEQLPPSAGEEIPDAVAAAIVTQLVEAIDEGMTRSAAVQLDSLGDDLMIPARYEDVEHFAGKVVEMVCRDPEFKDAVLTLAMGALKHLMEPV